MPHTFLSLVQAVADELGLRQPGVATGGTASTIVAANYPFMSSRANASAQTYEGAEVYMTGAWSGTPNPNLVAQYTPTTGTIGVGIPYAGDTPTSGDPFDLYLRGVTRDDLRWAVNQALRNLYYRTVVPLAAGIDDNDFDTPGTAAWTAVNATLTKDPTARHGPYALAVAATAPGGYAAQTAVVEPALAGAWAVSVFARTTGGSATLAVYDVTHSQQLGGTVGWASPAWGVLSLAPAIPAGTAEIEIRLGATVGGATAVFDDLSAGATGIQEYPLPAWVTRTSQIVGLGYSPGSGVRGDSHHYTPLRYGIEEDFSHSAAQFKLALRSPSGTPLWLEAQRPFPPLTTDSETSFVDRELLLAYATLELLRRLMLRPPAEQASAWREEYGRRRRKKPQVLSGRNLRLEYSGTY